MTLFHLLLAIIFFVPAETVLGELKRVHCGVLPYVFGIPAGLALGAAIVWLTFKSGQFLWLRFSGRSKRVDNFLGVGLLVLHICSLILGFTSGAFMGSILAKLFA